MFLFLPVSRRGSKETLGNRDTSNVSIPPRLTTGIVVAHHDIPVRGFYSSPSHDGDQTAKCLAADEYVSIPPRLTTGIDTSSVMSVIDGFYSSPSHDGDPDCILADDLEVVSIPPRLTTGIDLFFYDLCRFGVSIPPRLTTGISKHVRSIRVCSLHKCTY
jgi:hypothetical protein